VFLRTAKREKNRRRIAEKWSYPVTVEEEAEEDNDMLGMTMDYEDEWELDRFIRKTEQPASWGEKDLNPQMKEGVEKTVEQMVPERFHEYLHVFEKKASERMPMHKPWDHTIDLKPDFAPKKAKNIPLSPKEQEEVDEFLKDQLGKGYIRESKSPQTSATFFVPKKDMKKRLVQDYRPLNVSTIRNNYPLPFINELVDKVAKAKVFTKLDIRWGYNNMRMKERDEWKVAFTMHRGAFELLVMYFGLTNSPATFKMMMNSILRELIEKGCVVVYIDDIMIFTATVEGHDEIVVEVLKKLKENDLYLKPEKCMFKVPEVEFLGLVIRPDRVQMDETKVKVIIEWPVPRNLKNVRQFLGLASYYWRSVEGFSHVVAPLNMLIKKDQPWKWESEQDKVFNVLKTQFTTYPILTDPEPTRPLRVEADSSGIAMGVVLSMKCEDEKWRPCAYYSKTLSETEWNYDVHDREMLVIIRALETW
jgi:hypothetical protein